MPSRLKVVIKYPNGATETGDQARRVLAQQATQELIWGKGMPTNWATLKKIDRIKYMKKFIPPDWGMEIFMEPKATRPIRSAFKAAVKAPADIIPEGRVPNGGWDDEVQRLYRQYGPVAELAQQPVNPEAVPAPQQARLEVPRRRPVLQRDGNNVRVVYR
jgi:hypothetical protein